MGEKKQSSKGSPLPTRREAGSQVSCHAFGCILETGKKPEGGKTNHWIKPWPAAPPAKPAPLLRARQIPELNAIKPEFQSFFGSSRGIRLPVWVRILTFSPHETGMVPLPVPGRSFPSILGLVLGSPWRGQRLQVSPASRRLHSPSSPANSI